MTNKTINLTLVGLDGNAFSLMGAFQRQARREGWTIAKMWKMNIKNTYKRCPYMGGVYKG